MSQPQERSRPLHDLVWGLAVRAMERMAGHRRGDCLDFRLATSARDLVSDKGQALRAELEGLRAELEGLRAEAHALRGEMEFVAQSLTRLSATRPEDALRAARALRSSLQGRMPPETVRRLLECLPELDAEGINRLLGGRRTTPGGLEPR